MYLLTSELQLLVLHCPCFTEFKYLFQAQFPQPNCVRFTVTMCRKIRPFVYPAMFTPSRLIFLSVTIGIVYSSDVENKLAWLRS